MPHVTHFDRADVTELDALIRRNLEPARERGAPGPDEDPVVGDVADLVDHHLGEARTPARIAVS